MVVVVLAGNFEEPVGSFSGLKIACDGKWPVRECMFLGREKLVGGWVDWI
jgi:hypothetical protein